MAGVKQSGARRFSREHRMIRRELLGDRVSRLFEGRLDRAARPARIEIDLNALGVRIRLDAATPGRVPTASLTVATQ